MSILIPMTFGVFVLSKEIMWLYSKDVYTYVYPVLACAAVSRIIYGYESIVTYLVMYVNGLEKQLTVFLFGCGILNLCMNYSFVLVGKFTAFTALFSTMFSIFIFDIVATVYSEKKLGIKCEFFSKKICQYFVVSFIFIPVAVIINMLQLSYIWNIVLEMSICIGIYGVYLLYSKDPLVEVILKKIKRRK